MSSVAANKLDGVRGKYWSFAGNLAIWTYVAPKSSARKGSPARRASAACAVYSLTSPDIGSPIQDGFALHSGK